MTIRRRKRGSRGASCLATAPREQQNFRSQALALPSANEGARANREDAPRARSLTLDPPQHILVIHDSFLPETARYMQNIELGRVRQGGIRRSSKPRVSRTGSVVLANMR
jgi:hypothetical protein